MSLFQCEECGCRENTATSNYWHRLLQGEKEKLCSVCDPSMGRWHGKFPRLMLPKGEFKTNSSGNLEHIETGRTDVINFEIK